mgnify:CR=1 FL=1
MNSIEARKVYLDGINEKGFSFLTHKILDEVAEKSKSGNNKLFVSAKWKKNTDLPKTGYAIISEDEIKCITELKELYYTITESYIMSSFEGFYITW